MRERKKDNIKEVKERHRKERGTRGKIVTTSKKTVSRGEQESPEREREGRPEGRRSGRGEKVGEGKGT